MTFTEQITRAYEKQLEQHNEGHLQRLQRLQSEAVLSLTRMGITGYTIDGLTVTTDDNSIMR